MKLQTKLVTAFGVLAILTLTVAVIGYWQTKNLASALYEVGAVRLPSIQGLDMINEAMTTIRLSEQIMLTPNISPAELDEQVNEENKAWNRAEMGWALYEPLPQTPEESQKWSQFKPAWTAWKTDHQAVVALIVESRKRQDESLLVKAQQRSTGTTLLAKHAKELLSDILRINDMVAAEAKGRSVSGQDDVARVQNMIILSSLVAVIGVLFLGLFMARNFGRPIVQMADAMDRIAKGDLATTVPVHSRNEIGRMAQAMNNMVGALGASEESLKTSMEQLRLLGARLEQVQEHERKSIAREVHDQLGQLLTAIRMDIESLGRLRTHDAGKFDERLDAALSLSDQAIKTVQHISARLRPSVLDDFGLLAAIEWQAEEFQKRSGIVCTVHHPTREPSIEPDCSTVLFRIVQEALTNVARHAHARTVTIALEETTTDFHLTVKDDGIGIPADKVHAPASIGLLGIRERLHPFSGICTIQSLSSGGTTVMIRIPKNPVKENRS